MADTPPPPTLAYNKIGFHVGPGANVELLYRWLQELINAEIPLFVTAVDDYLPLHNALEWSRSRNTPHTFVFRLSNEAAQQQSSTAFDLERPDYSLPPERAAEQQWQALLNALPPDFDRARVWLQLLHDTSSEKSEAAQKAAVTDQADWLGEFAFAASHLALESGYRLALFGWANGGPPAKHWYATGMARFLSFCQRYPDQLAVSFHEFSHDVRQVLNTPDSKIGRFTELFAACDSQGIGRPTVLITEWGWTRDNVPYPELALQHIREAGELYAYYPEVRGAALWTLGRQPSGITRKVEQLVEPLTIFTLSHRFELTAEPPPIDSGETAGPIEADGLSKTAENFVITSSSNDPGQQSAPVVTESEDEARTRLAQSMARRRQYHTAVSTALGISDSHQRNQVLLDMADNVLVDEGYSDTYNQITTAILNQTLTDHEWADTIEIAINKENLDFVVLAANRMQEPALRSQMLQRLATLAGSETAPAEPSTPIESAEPADLPDDISQQIVPPTNIASQQMPPTETAEAALPRVWLYMGDGKAPGQMEALAQRDDLTWAANRHTTAGDIILMYRTDPYQDIAYLFRAAADAVPQSEAERPTGWQPQWQYAIPLADKLPLARPVKRTEIQAHPRLRDWSLARTPQGAMSRATDIRGEGVWPALRGLLLAWNPDLAAPLAAWEGAEADDLLAEAQAVAQAIPNAAGRREALLTFIHGLSTAAADRLNSLAQDRDRLVRRAAQLALGESPPTIADILAEAQAALQQQQAQQVLAILQDEDPQWQSDGTTAERAAGHALLAQAYEALGQPEQALNQWHATAELDPNHLDAFDGIARTTPAERLDDEAQFIEAIGRQAADAPGPAFGLAAIARRRGEMDAAVTYLEQAAERAGDEQQAQIEIRREIITRYLPAAEAEAPAGNGSIDPRQKKMYQLLYEHFNQNELEELCFSLGIEYEDLRRETRPMLTRELVLYMARKGRLLELESKFRELRPHLAHLLQESVADILADAQTYLEHDRPAQAQSLLQARAAQWEKGSAPEQATAHALLAQAYEALNRPADAYRHWRLKAALTPNTADAFEGMARTAPDEKVAEAEQWMQQMRANDSNALGSVVGLAALANRRQQPEQAADLLDNATAPSLVQQRQWQREAQRLRQTPAGNGAVPAARPAPLTTLEPARPGNLAANRLNLTLDDLAAAAADLDDNDQQDILSAFVQQTLRLPTLTAAHKRDLQARAARLRQELGPGGRLTAEAVAELRLPVLDALFITRPAHRRALIHAATTYVRQPNRRLALYLRGLARRMVRDLLPADVVATLRQMDPATQTAAFERMKQMIWQAGTAAFRDDPPQRIHDILAQAPPHTLAEWRAAEADNAVTLSGNLSTDVPAPVLAELGQSVGTLWALLDDLLHNRAGRFAHWDSWERFRHTPLDDSVASIALAAFHPGEHLPYHPKTAEAALRHLDLADKVRELDYRAYVGLAQTLARDDDLGLDNLADAALFLEQLAAGTIPFAVEETAGDSDSLISLRPPLAGQVSLHPNALDTELSLPPETIYQTTSALNAGHHVILIGPPGTGKTTVAQDICRLAHDAGCNRGYIAVTATADWTTFDTVGGYLPTADNQLAFSEGVVLRAIREQKWLIIDEINRADIDKAFGELFTVLSGQAVTLPYRDGYHPIRILPADTPAKTDKDYVIPATWRVIGTMNVYDKASLFEMSYAFMRRFAFVDVGIPEPAVFGPLLDRFLRRANLPDDHPVVTMTKAQLFHPDGEVMKNRPLGPAIAQDMIRYVAQRRAQDNEATIAHLAEAFLLYAIPQFDGLEEEKIATLYTALGDMFGAASAAPIRRRLRELFPQYAAAFPQETQEP